MMLRRWRRLDGARRRLLLEAVTSLAVARASLVVLPFERAMRTARLRQSRREEGPGAGAVAGVGWAISAAARRVPWRALCLEQALAARAMLTRRGIAATVHYGVARQDAALAAHAWVRAGEYDVVGCENAGEFTELARFGG